MTSSEKRISFASKNFRSIHVVYQKAFLTNTTFCYNSNLATASVKNSSTLRTGTSGVQWSHLCLKWFVEHVCVFVK